MAPTSAPVTGYSVFQPKCKPVHKACFANSSESATRHLYTVVTSSQSFTYSNNQQMPTALPERHLSWLHYSWVIATLLGVQCPEKSHFIWEKKEATYMAAPNTPSKPASHIFLQCQYYLYNKHTHYLITNIQAIINMDTQTDSNWT